MGLVANKRLAAQRRKISSHVELSLRQAEHRSPEAAERRTRIRGATRVGKSALKSREHANTRLAGALRSLISEGLSVRESAERVGVTYHEARNLIRAAEVAEAVRDQDVGGQVYPETT